ncbi:MAG: hypothetical protein KF864_14340 [Phycisphaeraceae bacterium]|nr:hypothetical protein [Phycisphaeraceae bacterium]MBX3408871.1 hypothetical protein [Phycisphaeraceae bacterium]
MSVDFSKFKPGQALHCTIEKMPRTEDAEVTLVRLMRLDPENKKALARAHRMRQQRLNVYNRGNRMWTSREKPARVVSVAIGENWTLPFSHDLTNDIKSVAQFINIKAK